MVEDEADPIPDPDDATLDFIADVGVQPHKRPAEQGIEDMEKLLAQLRSDLAFWEASRESVAGDPATPDMITRIQADIKDTERRLEEYKLQREGRN